MSYQLTFTKQIVYDPGPSGITIPISLSLIGHESTFAAKVDTGTSECVFASKRGRALGLDIKDGEKLLMNTVTGSFLTYRHEVTMKILDSAFDVRVCFAADEHFDRDVLGRPGFLDRVRIAIVDYEGKLYLSKYDEE